MRKRLEIVEGQQVIELQRTAGRVDRGNATAGW